MDHYEALGIERNATAADIKAAFRRQAKAAHPDREGGSHERMSAVNEAFRVLGDEEKRRAYDEGQPTEVPETEHLATQEMAQAFARAIDSAADNIVASAREALKIQLAMAESMGREVLATRRRIESQRKTVRVKGGQPNVLHHILDAKLQALDKKAQHAERGRAIFTEALKQLDAYEHTGKARPDESAEFVGFQNMFGFQRPTRGI